MKNLTSTCLIVFSLTAQACFIEAAHNKTIEINNQAITQNTASDEEPKTFALQNTQKEAPITQVNKTPIGNTLGLITLSSKIGRNDFIRFYNEDGSLWYKFSFHYDDSDGKFDYENEDFRPFAFHPDNFLLALKCVNEDKDRYEVIVNEEMGLRKFVKKSDSTLKLTSWQKHITKAFSVSFDQNSNSVREEPNGKLINAVFSEDNVFQPDEIDGDWLKVRWDNPEQSNKQEFGWIKWRDNQTLIVELFYFA